MSGFKYILCSNSLTVISVLLIFLLNSLILKIILTFTVFVVVYCVDRNVVSVNVNYCIEEKKEKEREEILNLQKPHFCRLTFVHLNVFNDDDINDVIKFCQRH